MLSYVILAAVTALGQALCVHVCIMGHGGGSKCKNKLYLPMVNILLQTCIEYSLQKVYIS